MRNNTVRSAECSVRDSGDLESYEGASLLLNDCRVLTARRAFVVFPREKLQVAVESVGTHGTECEELKGIRWEVVGCDEGLLQRWPRRKFHGIGQKRRRGRRRRWRRKQSRRSSRPSPEKYFWGMGKLWKRTQTIQLMAGRVSTTLKRYRVRSEVVTKMPTEETNVAQPTPESKIQERWGR